MISLPPGGWFVKPKNKPPGKDYYANLRRERIKQQRAAQTAKLREEQARRAAIPKQDPRPGYWLVCAAKGGPTVAACVRVVTTIAEPDNPDNAMAERSPHLAAFILDEPVALDKVWHWRLQEIDEGEYRYQCDAAAWARRHSPDEPIANPRKKVDLRNVPIPFTEDT